MSYRVIIKPRAKREILDAARFYASRSERTGLLFFEHVDEMVALLASQPKTFPEVRSPFRKAPLQRFPYALFYLIEGKKVYIMAAWHHSRDPNTLIL